MWLRLLVWILVTCFGASFGYANTSIILIAPVAAGPNVDPATYVHDQWIRWPKPYDETGLNRLISVTSGEDWRLSTTAFQFRESKDGYELATRSVTPVKGLFNLNRRFVVYRSPETDVDRGLLSMASVSGEFIQVSAQLETTGEDTTVLARVSSWDGVKKITEKLSGRSIVIEYPPRYGQSWSRFWRYGSGWPQGFATSGRIPGLVEARDVYPLLFVSSSENFKQVEILRIGGADRWLKLGTSASNFRILFALALLLPLIWGSFVISREFRFRGKELVPAIAISSLTSSVLVGDVSKVLGVSAFHVWWCALLFALSFLTAILLKSSSTGSHHPLLSTFSMLSFAAVVSSGTCSPLSPTMTGTQGIFGEQLALILILGVFSVRWSKGKGGFSWILPRATMILATTIGLFTAPEWSIEHPAIGLLPLVALLMGEGISWIPVTAIASLNPGTVATLIQKGVVWTPHGLVGIRGDREGIEIYHWVVALTRPDSLLIWSVLAGIAMMSSKFLGYQVLKVMRRQPNLTVGIQCIGAVFCMSLLQPALLTAIPWMACLAGLIWTFEAMQTL